jgi:TetR/AcrR family transcriptional repressor of bet genes
MMPKIGMEPLRRAAIIEATIASIHDGGLGGLTVGTVARRAGVSSALVHHYFGSKERLLLAAMRHLLADLGGEMRARLADARDPASRVRAIIAGCLAEAQFRPQVVSAWLAFYVAARHDPEAMRLLRVYVRRLESNLVAALVLLFPREDARRVARGAAALIDGLWLRSALGSDPLGPGEAAALVEDFVFAGMTAMGGASSHR